MSDPDDAPAGFLGRWARRKALVREGLPVPEAQPAAPAASPVAEPVSALVAPVEPELPQRPPPPTLDDAAQLVASSDFRRFVASDVTPEVKNAALKKLFADPHYNVMDGLDTYIDDYGKPDPIPASMLRQMVQAQFLGLFDDEADKAAKVSAAGAIPDGAAPGVEAQLPPEPPLPIADDQDPAVRLQPLDAAGPGSDPGGVEQDTGRER